MKIFTLSIAMLLLSAMAIAQTQVCPTDFKRNNGNGACAAGKILFTYSACPSPPYIIDSIRANGAIANVTVSTGTCTNNGKVEYCFTGGNLPTANILQVYFSTPNVPNSGFGCFVPSGGPLPVLISSFFAKRNGNAVVLNWTSESEINAKEFVIERNSGSGFVAIGTVAAQNRETGSSYTYTDNNNSSKTVSQYRLKMFDKDASYKLSEIRPVKGTAAVSDFTVFPNPSMGNAKVSITDIAEATTVDVIDNAGRVLKTIELQNKNTVDINNLQKGIYLIRITNKVTGDVLTKKLTVSN